MCSIKEDCIIQTKRLLLREISIEDANIVVQWRSDPAIYRFFKNPHVLSLKEHLQWYENRYISDTNIVSWIAYQAMEPCGLFSVRKENPVTAEISYLTDPHGQRQGIASEAVCALEKWAEKKWNIKYMIAEIHKDNEKSIRFIKKNGYQLYDCNQCFVIFRKAVNSNKDIGNNDNLSNRW